MLLKKFKQRRRESQPCTSVRNENHLECPKTMIVFEGYLGFFPLYSNYCKVEETLLQGLLNDINWVSVSQP